MGYQALLYCPDEKTARTLTPIFTELEFEVVPCSEPFAAVKKLMDSHFDAVVVDCDNEQNAALLFKSANSSPHNQSALAVAVVEGQSDVAKAFRIGANLVLPKPINVEQTKGTLRVARGLLRKTETAKMKATAAPFAFDQAAVAPAPLKQSAPKTAAPRAVAPILAPAPNPKIQDVIATQIPLPAEPEFAPVATSAARLDALSAKPQTPLPQGASSPAVASANSPASAASGSPSGSAAAPAPAKEVAKPMVAAPHPLPAAVAKPESLPKSQDEEEMFEDAPPQTAQGLPVPAFALTQTQPTSPAGKKMLIALAAIVLIVIAGYAAWTQLGLSLPHSLLEKLGISGPSTAPSWIAPANTRILATSSGAASSPATPPIANGPASNINGVAAIPPAASANSSEPASALVASNRTSADSAGPSAPIVVKSSLDNTLDHALSKSIEPAAAPASASQPQLQTIKVPEGVSRGLLMKQVEPTYPAEDIHMRVEGDVQMLATVSKSGKVSTAKILSGNAQLAQAAVDAVKQWQYKPYLLNGEPIEIQTEITVRFKLPR